MRLKPVSLASQPHNVTSTTARRMTGQPSERRAQLAYLGARGSLAEGGTRRVPKQGKRAARTTRDDRPTIRQTTTHDRDVFAGACRG